MSAKFVPEKVARVLRERVQSATLADPPRKPVFLDDPGPRCRRCGKFRNHPEHKAHVNAESARRAAEVTKDGARRSNT